LQQLSKIRRLVDSNNAVGQQIPKVVTTAALDSHNAATKVIADQLQIA
jgi:hypothetical protein